jgi:hypothetical protein
MIFRRQSTRTEHTLRNARWSPGEAEIRTELLDLALRRGVLVPIHSHIRGLLGFNNEFNSLRSLLDREPTLSPNATAFAEEFLGQTELRKILHHSN